MAVRDLIIFSVLLSSLVASCYAAGSFSELKNTLSVSATPTGEADLKAGKDQITVTWGLNPNVSKAAASAYKQVEVKLCYHKESQVDRPWRKTEDDLSRDKTCQFLVVKKEFKASSTESFTYTVKKDVPTAHYFIRAYVRDGPDGKQLAYGQTTGLDLSIKSISGRSTSIDVAASVFSAFSVLSLVFFFYLEKRKAKRAS